MSRSEATTEAGQLDRPGGIVIVVGLLVLSTDRSLRELKAKRWKDLQRLNYTLFALVLVHALFYGALRRPASPFTIVLIVTVVAVLVSQALGIRLWKRRHARPTINSNTNIAVGP